MAVVTKTKEMDIPVESLWAAITDFEHYPEFVEQVVAAKKISDGDKFQVQFELEIVKRFQYTLEFKQKPLEELSWNLIESNFFKVNRGRWILARAGKKTKATYEVDVDFPFLVPGWITKKLTEVQLPKMLDAFEARAMQTRK